MPLHRSYLSLLAVMLIASAAIADDCGCETVVAAGCEPQPVCVQKTVCVPQWVTETRTVTCTEYAHEQHTKTVTCYRNVPETKEVTRQCTVMVPETAHQDRHVYGVQAGVRNQDL